MVVKKKENIASEASQKIFFTEQYNTRVFFSIEICEILLKKLRNLLKEFTVSTFFGLRNLR